MSDPKRESDNTQEAQDIKAQNHKAFYDNIPEEMALQIKQAAAAISGISPEELTLEQSIKILEGPNPDPKVNAELDRIAKEATDQLFNGITDDGLNKLNDSVQDGTLGKTLALTAEMLAQQAQEAHEAEKAPEQTRTPPPRITDKDRTATELLRGAVEDIKQAFATQTLAKEAITAAQAMKAAEGTPNGQERETISLMIETAIQAIKELYESPIFQTIKENIQTISEFTAKYNQEIAAISEAAQDMQDLAPFLAMELEELERDPQISDMTMMELLNNQGGELFRQAVERAQKRKAEFEETQNTIAAVEWVAEDLPRIKYNPTTKLETVTDKLANVFYSLAAPAGGFGGLNGQRQMIPLKYEGKKSKKEITLFYDYVYDETTLAKYSLSKEFDDFDFFVMTILDNLFVEGNTAVTLTKIYNEMGNTKSPNPEQLEPILNSLIKGMSTIITIDDMEVQKAWNIGPNGKYHVITSPVIPVQLGTERFLVNGRISNGFVRINARSPFLQVAAPLGHVTAWDKEILKLYKGRRTKRYYSVLRFLMMQIGWMRNSKSKRSNKILYDALYSHTGDRSTRAKQLTRDMMYRLLDDVFIPAQYVTSYKEDGKGNPGVILTINKNRQKLPS